RLLFHYLISTASPSTCTFFFYCYGNHRDLHSFPTRRSSDLENMRVYAETVRTQIPELNINDAAIATMVKNNKSKIIELEKQLKEDRKSTRLNSSHVKISYAVFCLKKKKKRKITSK